MIASTISEIHPAGLAGAVAARAEKLEAEGFRTRLLEGDAGLWPAGGEDRLGWLRLPTAMAAEVQKFDRLREEVVADGVRDVVVLGMGGSSLAPEVFAKLLGGAEGVPRLTVVDTTHPATVAACLAAFPPSTSLYIAASKSGTTIETLGLLDAFWQQAGYVGSVGFYQIEVFEFWIINIGQGDDVHILNGDMIFSTDVDCAFRTFKFDAFHSSAQCGSAGIAAGFV